MAMKVTNAQPLSLAAPPGVPRLSVDKSVETDAQSAQQLVSARLGTTERPVENMYSANIVQS